VTSPDIEAPDLYSIADLAREFGISTRAIRFYESKGLIAPERLGATDPDPARQAARLFAAGHFRLSGAL
jgi:hypothetical protein